MEATLRQRADSLDKREEKLILREKEVEARDAELKPREMNVAKKEKDLIMLEASLRELQDEINIARITIEKRDKELTEKEAELLRLSELSSQYEAAIKEYAAKYQALEEKILSEERNVVKILDELSSRREEMLVKIKALQEQEDLLAESKRLVMEEQRRFVDWERRLNDREAELARRERTLEKASSIAKLEASSEPQPIWKQPSVSEKVGDKAEAVDQTAVVKEIETTVVESEESGLAEIFCPECRTIVSASADSCYACGADLKNPKPKEPAIPEPKAQRVQEKAEEKVEQKEEPKPLEPKPEEKRSEEERKEAEARKSVSIRKIIKRK